MFKKLLTLSLALLPITTLLFSKETRQSQSFCGVLKKELANTPKNPLIGIELLPKRLDLLKPSAEEPNPADVLLDRLQQFSKASERDFLLLEQAVNNVELGSICTEEVLFDLTKIADKKKELEHLCIIIDGCEKRLEKHKTDFMQWLLSTDLFDDEEREAIKKYFPEIELGLTKRCFAIRKECALEFIKLLNFFSIRHDVEFLSDIENKLFTSYLKKIEALFKEEHETRLLDEQQRAAAKSKKEADQIEATKKHAERPTIAEATARDGAKIEIKVNSLEYSMFEMNGRGFKPSESLNFISNSCKEVLHFSIIADETGNIGPVGMNPAVIGLSGGMCHIDVLREGGPIQVKLPWGTEALKSVK